MNAGYNKFFEGYRYIFPYACWLFVICIQTERSVVAYWAYKMNS